ncbi:MAG: hypothetical protein GX287_04810 [Fusobacteria bacterium]|nr:hypothetical protein [Fusobacteriota bacterium]
MSNFIKKFRDRFKFKNRSNIITFIDIIFIVVIFIFIKNFYKLTAPTSDSITKNKIKYNLYINKHKYELNDTMLINLELRNRSKKKIELINEKEKPIRVVIYNENKDIVYSNDYMDRNRENPKIISVGGYAKINIGENWDFESEISEITKGSYKIKAIFNSGDVELEIPFIIF